MKLLFDLLLELSAIALMAAAVVSAIRWWRRNIGP